MYDLTFNIIVLLCVASQLLTTQLPHFQNLLSAFQSKKQPPSVHTADPNPNPQFQAFQHNYLLVYFLAVAADWIQGPYVYALYSQYGYAKTDIARLYIAGFASSAVFGTFVAAIADRFGRRNNALLYCLLYSASCLTKHSPTFSILLLGRILGGIAYSILFSAFEAWMVYEHHARRFDHSTLASTFARAQFGNAVVAIACGQIAGRLAHAFGKTMPFDMSIAFLLVLSVVLLSTWSENFGDASQPVLSGFAHAFHTLRCDANIMLLGVSQAAFEGALYTFTFVWTPALQPNDQTTHFEIPHGTIFSTFMACSMIGSNIFAITVSQNMCVLRLMRIVFVIAFVAFAIATRTNITSVLYFCFLVFEVLCGMYFPAMATIRAPYIPEQCRSAILTFFRLPINVLVVFALYEDMSVRHVFALCAVLMLIGICSQHALIRRTLPSDALPTACDAPDPPRHHYEFEPAAT